MNIFQLLVVALFMFGFTTENKEAKAREDFVEVTQHLAINDQGLIIIDQDYNKALEVASKIDKLIFVDFYTTWCSPCKKLDRLVFQNDSIQQILEKDFIILKYDAENDTMFHLSKKHHVSSYPTGLVLNKEGYVLNRKTGFQGDDFQSLGKSVLDFSNESIILNKNNKVIKGYSNIIEAGNYPQFYVDYVNRTNTKKDTESINEYLNNEELVYSEEYFSTLIYFASEASDKITDKTIQLKETYTELYGKSDVELLFYFLTIGKFKRAIAEKSQQKYDEAISFAKSSLSTKWTDDILPTAEIQLLKAQNKWDEVFELRNAKKDRGEMDNGFVNHFSWSVYKECDNQKVIQKCIAWMKEVTDEEPTYAYLDTYAYLLYKSGNKEEASRIALLALEIGKKEGDSTKSIETLMSKL